MVTKLTEFANHSISPRAFGFIAYGWSPLFLVNAFVKDEPNESTESMGDSPDSLFITETWHEPVKGHLKDAALDLYGRVGRLIENSSRIAVPLG